MEIANVNCFQAFAVDSFVPNVLKFYSCILQRIRQYVFACKILKDKLHFFLSKNLSAKYTPIFHTPPSALLRTRDSTRSQLSSPHSLHPLQKVPCRRPWHIHQNTLVNPPCLPAGGVYSPDITGVEFLI